MSLLALIITLVGMCITIMTQLSPTVPLSTTLQQYPLTIVFTILGLVSAIFVSIMLLFHSYLIVNNLTTK